MKKKNKKKLSKGNLLIVGFLFIFISYLNLNAKDNNIDLIADNNNIYYNIDVKEAIKVIDNETAILVVVDKKQDINSIISKLMSLKENEKIYVYNSKNDEVILEYINNNITVKQSSSKDYNKLINKLGLYKDNYIIENEVGNKIETNYSVINTPSVFFIKNGNILLSYNNISNTSEEEVTNVYKMGFNLIRTNK